MVFASVKTDDFVVVKGGNHLRRIRSSSFGHRGVCGQCGTPLYMRVDHQPETCDFSVATLDDPDQVQPAFHIFWASRLGYLDYDDGLPKYEGFRRGTRRLEGAQPPI